MSKAGCPYKKHLSNKNNLPDSYLEDVYIIGTKYMFR